MDSVRIKVKGMDFSVERGSLKKYIDLKFLEAFSVSHIEMKISGAPSQNESQDFFVDGYRVSLSQEVSEAVAEDDKIEFLISYYGVRDYSALFCFLSDDELVEKMGRYYRESEICFASGCWLSYLMMVGAIFEGILYDKLKDCIELDRDIASKNFGKLLEKAHAEGHLLKDAYDTMDSVRKKRNLIHVGCEPETYPSYTDAMDAKVVLRKELVKMWGPGEESFHDFS